MSEERDRLLGERALSFWGTVTGSVSHEINNVISIISEYSGLLGDLVSGAEKGRTLEHEKLARLAERIAAQVARGKAITKRLNRLAHSVDAPSMTFSINEVMEDSTELARRFSDLKAVHLASAFPEEVTTLTSNRFQLQQAVFISIRLALNVAEKDDTICVSFQRAGPRVEIRVECPHAVQVETLTSDLSHLGILLGELGGEAKVASTDTAKGSITLYVPVVPAVDSDCKEGQSS